MPTPEVCQRGHAWTPENTRIQANGRRCCRACRKLTRQNESADQVRARRARSYSRRKADGRVIAYRASTRERRNALHASYVRAKRASGVTYDSPESQAGRRHRRRAREASAFTDGSSLSWQALWARGDRDCALCGDPVDAERFDRWRPSLDHRVPLARGGSHTLDNSQLAHLTCNCRKGARPKEMDYADV